jgi:polysaccharide export outer membrane protein
MRALIGLLLTCVLLNGCASTVGKLPPLVASTRHPYVLGPGDALLITVFGDADLTGPYKVSDGGAISMSLIGQVNVQGLTVQELQQKLVERLKQRALKAPDVAIQVTEYRPFFILGEVKNPGSYAYVPNMTVLAAVAMAGGFTFRAAEDSISVTRAPNGEARASRSDLLQPGDVVNVFERHF